ncbi:MAG: DUF4388 domain-containing protein [Planctomycetota bacterium]|nr:DUF4388 domain-containing protein [Planctomycetota bacterium]
MKGLLRQVKMFDFLQFLNVSGRQGVLSMSAGSRRTQIYFGKEGVRLLSAGRRRRPLFGELLVRWGRIPESELVEALEEQSRSRKPLGEILAQRNRISKEDVEECLYAQVAEEICDAVTDENAEFEFLSLESPPSEGYGTLPLDGSGIILEAARRVDEWQHLRKQITSFAEIYKVRDRAELPPASTLRESSSAVVQEILFLIDGFRTVNEVIVESGITKLEVCRILSLLKNHQTILFVERANKLGVIERLQKQKGIEFSIHCAENFLFEDPLDTPVREKLAHLYLLQHYKEDAYNEFLRAAEQYLKAQNFERAVNLMREASHIYPERIGLRLKISETLLKAGKIREAAVEGLAATNEAIKRLLNSKEKLSRFVGTIGYPL